MNHKINTTIVKLTDKNAIRATVNVLKHGGVAIIPTETSYGIAADATNKKAVARVCDIKKRKPLKFMPVIVASVTMAKRFFSLNKSALKLCRFFPAPLTLVVRQRKKIASNISSDGTVAFRVPINTFCREVSRKLKRPITSTSANISGRAPTFSFQKARRLFFGKVDLIVNAGTLKKTKPSTVVSCSGKLKILRKGAFRL